MRSRSSSRHRVGFLVRMGIPVTSSRLYADITIGLQVCSIVVFASVVPHARSAPSAEFGQDVIIQNQGSGFKAGELRHEIVPALWARVRP